jgi:cobalamin biosynthesis Co2+ chelatase CbiK
MAEMNPELKPLRPKQRKFIHLMVYQGLDRNEAYAQAYDKVITEENYESIRTAAAKAFYTPHINNYYHALMEEIRDREIKKGVWTKEVATEKLMRLIERAEQDIYGDEEHEPKQLTMSRLNAIILPVKELNLMNGFNQTNMNVDGCVVQICGEEDIPE